MKNITILGASAGVGLQTVNTALDAGYRVTTLSRSTASLPRRENLHIVQGSATSQEDVKKTITGADVVMGTLGTGTKLDWNAISRGTTLYSESAAVLLKALHGTGLSVPLIVVTGFGAGDSGKHVPFPTSLFMRFLLGKLYQDKTRMEQMISSGYSNWTIVRPGILTDKPPSGKYRAYNSFDKAFKTAAISRADVARFLVDQVANPGVPGKYISLMGA